MKKKVYILQIIWVLIAIAATLIIVLCSDKLLSLHKVKGGIAGNEGMMKVEHLNGYDDINKILAEIGEEDQMDESREQEDTEAGRGEEAPEGSGSGEEASAAGEKKLVALTFDDGPYPKVTSRILDILEEHGAKATFFVMGNRVVDYSNTIKREYELGMQVANHSYSHKQLTKLTAEGIEREVEFANGLINQVVDVGDALLRPPYGEHNELVDKVVKVPMITWSVDSKDWLYKDKDKIIEQVLNTLGDNDIILMHDLYPTTADAVEYLIPYLISEGYEFVTVDELFERNGTELEAGKVYRKPVKSKK